MALELGRDFPARWLAAPDVVRQRIYDELNGICRLLEPNTVFAEWQAEENARPPVVITSTSAPRAASAIDLSLKKRFLREADDLIEQALEPIRQQLREWLYQEMQQVLAEHAGETTPVAEVDLNDDATMV
jgi:hypothetical protein